MKISAFWYYVLTYYVYWYIDIMNIYSMQYIYIYIYMYIYIYIYIYILNKITQLTELMKKLSDETCLHK